MSTGRRSGWGPPHARAEWRAAGVRNTFSVWAPEARQSRRPRCSRGAPRGRGGCARRVTGSGAGRLRATSAHFLSSARALASRCRTKPDQPVGARCPHRNERASSREQQRVNAARAFVQLYREPRVRSSRRTRPRPLPQLPSPRSSVVTRVASSTQALDAINVALVKIYEVPAADVAAARTGGRGERASQRARSTSVSGELPERCGVRLCAACCSARRHHCRRCPS